MRDPLVGLTLDDRYHVRARLARGGMASIYIAQDQRLERLVALKVMHPHLAESEQFAARFRREARSAAKISHRGVVPVWDQGSADGQAYLVMELIDGPNLRTYLMEEGPLTVEQALDFTSQMLEALNAAHSVGVVHRDLKPENVLVDSNYVLRVTDFGLARAISDASLSSTGSILGTVSYLAPEVALSGSSDERTDVYAIGLMLYEMLTGTVPWLSATPLQAAYARVHEDIPAPSDLVPWLPSSIDELVQTFCARNPDQRPALASEALAMVQAVENSLPPEVLSRRHDQPIANPSHSDGTQAVGVLGTTTPLPVSSQVIHTSGSRPGNAPTKKRERAPLVILIAVIVCATLAAGTWWWLRYGPGSYVDVPQVAGHTEVNAEAILEEAGFEAIVERDFSDEVPAGTVISSTPEGGSRAHKNTIVTLVVSDGIQMVTVPKIVGETRDKAETLIREAGLTLGKITEEWSEDVPAGVVISAVPSPEASVRHDATVEIKVSKGREPIEVPSVTGIAAGEASAAIEEAGLIASSSEANSDDIAEGIVISQSPTPDEGPLHRGDTVSYVVSLGPELVEVPFVAGKTLADAQSILEAAGFTVEVKRITSFFDLVGDQSPASGEMVARGSTITLTVV